MKETVFCQKHKDLGAKMAEFAGYNMPIQYEGLTVEHHNVRNNVGVFDVSHMGEFRAKGPHAKAFMQYVTVNDVAALVDGKVQYTCLPNGKGGIVDDMLVYRIADDHYFMVPNANVAETETYLPDSKSFTLKVTVEGYVDATFKYNDTDIVGQGASEVGAELTATRNEVLTLYANKAYAKPEDTHIKIYGSKYEGTEEEGNRTLTEPSYIKLSVAVPYVITKVVMTATGKDYIKEWKDQSGKEAVISGTTATWEGVEADVILTNLSTAQARIKTIEVTYVNTDIVTAISTPTSIQSETAIYNLAGQRLSKMQKGINIVGGKKILK